MADKRISQLVDRGTVANNDVVPIVVSGAVTTNKATISSIQTFMQGNLDLGVTSVGITLGSSGTDVSVSGSPITSSGNITINLPTASATNRGLLSSADWTTFNSKQQAITLTTTGTSGAATLVSGTLNIPNYSTDLSGYVTLGTTQTITAQKTFTTSGSSDTMIISHGSGSGFALDVLKAGNGEAIRVTKSSGSGNAMTISGGNFEAGTIVKTGGTSSQFLKADGSVDSSTYLTTASAGTTYVPYTGAGANVDLGIYNLTANAVNVNASGSNAGVINLESNTIFSLVNGYGTIGSGTTNQFNFYQTTGAGVFRGAILSLNSITASATRTYTLPDSDGTLALTSSLGAYLPLAGGTLTGALNGTSASFTGTIANPLHVETSGADGGIQIYRNVNSDDGSAALFMSHKSTAGVINTANIEVVGSGSMLFRTGATGLGNFGTIRLSISASTGAATFSSSVFAGGSVLSSPSGADTIIGAYGGQDCSLILKDANQLWELYVNDDFYINRGSTNVLSLNRTTGAATFSSSVTAAAGINAIGQQKAFSWQRTAGTASDVYSLNADSGSAYVQNDTTSNILMSWLEGGNVGIGTASPITYTNYKSLHISGATATGSALLYLTNSTQTIRGLFFEEGGAGDERITIGSQSNHPFTFVTNDTERMRITSAGNVGIGTASPTDFGSTYKVVSIDGAGGGGVLDLMNGGTRSLTLGVDASEPSISSRINGNPIVFRTNSGGTVAERMRITSGGNVLIGQTTASGVTNGIYLRKGIESGFIVTDDVAIQLARYGSNGDIQTFYRDNTKVGSISVTTTATSYNTSSDYRLKENVKPVENALSTIEKLKPCTFNFITESEEEVMGFLAHEVQEVMPQAVKGEKDGFRIEEVEVSPAELDEEGNVITEAVIEEKEVPIYQGIDHSKLVPLLVAAIQELKTEIDSLKNQIK